MFLAGIDDFVNLFTLEVLLHGLIANEFRATLNRQGDTHQSGIDQGIDNLSIQCFETHSIGRLKLNIQMSLLDLRTDPQRPLLVEGKVVVHEGEVILAIFLIDQLDLVYHMLGRARPPLGSHRQKHGAEGTFHGTATTRYEGNGGAKLELLGIVPV